jgi:O-antigen/teichoic acid export membrane protein
MSFKNNPLYKSIAVSVGSSYFFYALNFGGQLILMRLLMPEDFGVIALTLAVLGIIDLFVGFSIPMAYVQAKESKTLFSSAYILSLLVGILPIIISLIIYYPLSIYYNSNIALFALLISLSKPFGAIGSIILANMEKKLHFGKSYILRGIALSSSLFFAIFFAYNEFGIYSLLVREILSSLILFGVAKWYFTEKVAITYQVSEIKSLMHFSTKMIVSRGAEIAYFKIPLLIIGTLYSTATLGLFTQAFYLASLTSTALGPITEKIAFVFYSHAKNNNTCNKKDFNTINLIALIVALPASAILFFYPTEILYFLYGEKWINAGEYLKYLSLFGLLLPIFNNLKSYFYSAGKNNYVTVAYLLALVVAIIFIALDFLTLFYFLSLLVALGVLYMKKLVNNSDKKQNPIILHEV